MDVYKLIEVRQSRDLYQAVEILQVAEFCLGILRRIHSCSPPT